MKVLLERGDLSERQKRTATRLHTSRGGLLATWLVHAGAAEEAVMSALASLSGLPLLPPAILETANDASPQAEPEYWWRLGAVPLGEHEGVPCFAITIPEQAAFAKERLANAQAYLASEREIRLLQTRFFGPRQKDLVPFELDEAIQKEEADDERRATIAMPMVDPKTILPDSEAATQLHTALKDDESANESGEASTQPQGDASLAPPKVDREEEPPKTEAILRPQTPQKLEPEAPQKKLEPKAPKESDPSLVEDKTVSRPPRPASSSKTAEKPEAPPPSQGELASFDSASTLAAEPDDFLKDLPLADPSLDDDDHAPTLAMSREDVMKQLSEMDLPAPTSPGDFDEPTFAMPREMLEEFMSMNDAAVAPIADDKTVTRAPESASLAQSVANDFDEPTLAIPYASLAASLEKMGRPDDGAPPSNDDIQYFDDDWSSNMPASPGTGFEDVATEMAVPLQRNDDVASVIILDEDGTLLPDDEEVAGENFGVQIRGYTVVAKLGAGGMATVYRAKEHKSGRFVALKVLSPTLAGDTQFIERFKRETRACASLEDAHVVPVYDYGSSEGVHYMATEELDGGSLRELLNERGALPIPVAIKLAQHVLLALHAADEAGIVHRDVKPGNVLLSLQKGVAKLCDFGIAKADTDADITKTGALFGTPAYMSPEQTLGRPLDGRSDLFSAGVILYECLAGQNPFICENASGTLLRVSRMAIPTVLAYQPGVPRLLVDVLERLMTQKPDERYPQAAEALAQLAPLVDVIDRDTPSLLKDYFAQSATLHAQLQRGLSQSALALSRACPAKSEQGAYWAFVATTFDSANLSAQKQLENAARMAGLSFQQSDNPQARELLRGLEDTPDDMALLRRLVALYRSQGNAHLAAAYSLQMLRHQDDDALSNYLDQTLGTQVLAPLQFESVNPTELGVQKRPNSNEGVDALFSQLSEETPRPKMTRQEDPRVAALRRDQERSRRNPAFGALQVNSISGQPPVAAPLNNAKAPRQTPPKGLPQNAKPKSGGKLMRVAMGLFGLGLVALLVFGAVQFLGEDPSEPSVENAKSLLAAGDSSSALSMLNSMISKGAGDDTAQALLVRAQCHISEGNKSFASADLQSVLVQADASAELKAQAQALLDSLP